MPACPRCGGRMEYHDSCVMQETPHWYCLRANCGGVAQEGTTVTPNGPREYRVKFTDGDEAEYTDSTIGLEAAQSMLGKRQGVIEYNDHAGWFELDGAASQAANASTPAADATPAAPGAQAEG